jgi:isovaleryl-CoA dehydrogenase
VSLQQASSAPWLTPWVTSAPKEFGMRAQRMALTEGGANPHKRDVAAKMGSLGWLGLSIPESCGGSGGGLFEACLFVEALSHGRARSVAIRSP